MLFAAAPCAGVRYIVSAFREMFPPLAWIVIPPADMSIVFADKLKASVTAVLAVPIAELAAIAIVLPAVTVKESVELAKAPTLAYTAPKLIFEFAPEAVSVPVVLEASK